MRQKDTVRGLYDPHENYQSGERRRRIRQHNLAILQSAGAQLFDQPLRLEKRSSALVPDLWVNQEGASSFSGDYALELWLNDPRQHDRQVLRLTLNQRSQALQLAAYTWSFYPDFSDRAIRVTSSLRTEIGYEGNGFGSSLISLGAAALEKAVGAIRAQDRKRKPKPVYWLVNDQAMSAAFLGGQERPDAPRGRAGWTTNQLADRAEFITDPAVLERELGFRPAHAGEEGHFFYVIR